MTGKFVIPSILLSVAADAQTPLADEIVSRVVERYSTLRSYQDTGVVLSHWPEKPGPDVIHFSTYFVRPDGFRFDWTSHHPYPPLRHIKEPYVIWSNKAGAFFYRYRGSPARLERMESLERAVAMATGISVGSVYTVGGLLTPKTGTFGITIPHFKDLKVVSTIDFEVVQCYRMTGTYPDGEPCVVLISTGDYLIRKIERTAGGVRHEEIHRDIVTDGEIPAATFDFQPPQ
jgi:outer membrane lipoprotein-sorting protein